MYWDREEILVEEGLHKHHENEVEVTNVLFLIVQYLSQKIVITQRLVFL